MKKRIISLFLAVVMIVGMIPLSAITALAEEGVKYLEYNTSTGAFEEHTCTDYTALTNGVTSWTGGWYVAPAGKLELGDVDVNGSSYLILTDGCELTVNGGIHVKNGSSFTIYAQSEGENAGVLVANGGKEHAGIGSVWKGSCGDITINGGNITANGGDLAPGIGSACYASCGNITINGGTVKANGGQIGDLYYAGPGIGTAERGSCGNITINGGEITAIGGDSGGNGIGSSNGSCGKVIINGGYVAAAGGKAPSGGTVCGKPFYAEIALGEHISVLDCVNDEMIDTDSIGVKNYCDTLNSLSVKSKSGRPVSAIFAFKNELSDIVVKYYEIIKDLEISTVKYRIIDFDSVPSITSETRSLTTGWYKVDGEVTIDASLTVTGDVHLMLNDGCKLTVSYGVLLEKGNSLSVYAGTKGDGQLIAKQKNNNRGAGIGGYYSDAGDLTVYGGNITANGGGFSAGIGGGEKGSGGTVTVYDGSVTATGGDTAAGIGGGSSGNGGNVTVYGGSVTANGGDTAAGIGGGSSGNGGNVTVYGGSVTAKGGNRGAGIGSGSNGGNGGTLNIYGGNINAVGGDMAAGIGGGKEAHGAEIHIGGGSIVATGGKGHRAIGAGYTNTPDITKLNNKEISLFANATLYNGRDGSMINAEWYQPVSGDGYNSYISPVNNTAVTDEQGRNTVYFYAISDTSKQTRYLAYNTNTNKFDSKSINEDKAFGVGGLTTWDMPWYEVDGNQIIDGTVTVNGNVNLILKDGCKLEVKGSILVKDGNSLTIYAQSDGEKMGSLIATGDYGAAGIGGGDNRGTDNIKIPGTITVHGGNITATGGFGAAGIGGGYNENGGTVTVYGGNITATGGDHGAGIGSGYYTLTEETGYGGDYYGDGGTVTVNGGNITATGKIDGAGIGGGRNANGNTFTMTGGVVTAIGEKGAGIGGGYNGYGSDFIFSGGCVTAVTGSTKDGSGIGMGENGGSNFGGHHEFTVADGTVIKAGATATNNYFVTAARYTQDRNAFVSVHLHDYTGEYKNNGDGTHSRQCAYCDEFGTPENHTFVNHICACGATNEHSFTGDYVDNGDGTHSRKCTGCEALGTPEAHAWQSVDKNTHKCTVCETVGNHTDGDKDGKCDLCGYVICTHANTEIVYEWNTNYFFCTATKHCNDCGSDILTENATEIKLVEDTHGANCQTMGKGHYEATFATLGTAKTAEKGTDTKVGEHNYVDFVCEYCGDELLEGAKADAIKAIHNAADSSDDEVVKFLAEKAENTVQGAESVAAVINARDYWITAINKQLGAAAHTHTYSTEWSRNETHHWHNSTCGHSGLTSGFGEHSFGEGVVDGGKTVYTCSVCGYKKYVYNAAGDNEGEIITEISYNGISLTLSSDISINFYMSLTEDARENGTMTFDIGGRTVSGVSVKYNEKEKEYYFSAPLTVLEMAETVTATFTYNGVDYIQKYSVADYIAEIVTNETKYSAEAVALAKKIANYGYYAQIYLASIHTNVQIVKSGEGYDEMYKFDDADINVAKAKEALAEHAVQISGTSDNLSLYGTTVYFDSATALNYYVTVKDGVKPTATAVNTATGKEKAVEIKLYKNNIYIVSVKDVLATELADTIEVTINGEFILTGSVFAYCNAVMTRNGQTDAAKNAMAAFCEYYKAAVEYAEASKPVYKVTFYMNARCESIDVNVKHGEKVARPNPDPKSSGEVFDGWYEDDTFNIPWNFDTPITDNTTINAKWISEKDFNSAKEDAKSQISNLAESVKSTIKSLNLPNDIKQNCLVEVDNTAHTAAEKIENAEYTDKIKSIVVEADVKINNILQNAKAAVMKYTVTFNMMGHGTAPSSQTVENGGKATMPDTPAAEGFTFGGWYKDQNLQTEWNFATDTVTENTTLYAKWTSDSQSLEDGYYLAGTLNGGSFWDVSSLNSGMKLEANAAVPGEYKIDRIFCENDRVKVVKVENGEITAWYKNGEYNDYEVSADEAGEGTLLFRSEGDQSWTYFYFTVIPKEKPKYTVTFNMMGHGTAPSSQTVEKGGKVTKPDDPAAEGYLFGGWYKDENLQTVWKFNSDTVTADTTLYAKWTQTIDIDFSSYCLCGYINGADYGMTYNSNPQWNEPGEYIFSKDGTLTATFEKDSLVQLKTLHGEWWYAFDNRVADGTPTKLYEASDIYKEQMFVPGETTVTFFITLEMDGSYLLRYELA